MQQTIGQQLRKHRLKIGATQKELGAIISPKSKCPYRVWQDYENKKILTDSNIEKLKKIGLNVSVTYKIDTDENHTRIQ